jgi:transposase
MNCKLFPSQRQDCRTIHDMWQEWDWKNIKYVVADKGYDSVSIREFIKSKQAIPVIPRRKKLILPDGVALKNAYDTTIYKERHLIERLFGRLKENKRIAMRFDKLDVVFSSFIALALINPNYG